MRQGVSVAVVIPAYGPAPHLPAILDSIAAGSMKPAEIVVSHSGTDDPAPTLRTAHPRIKWLHAESRLFAGAARNRGVSAAESDVVAFCDSDVLPDADWLDRLVTALLSNDRRFVVGSVGMARTGGYWGEANWLCEFSEQAPWRSAGVQTGGASCNMAVRRSHFEAVGGFREDLTPGEDTYLFHALREQGLEQWFEPAARVGHYNHSGFAAFMRHQHALGRNFAHVRKAAPLAGSSAIRFPPLAAGLWLVKDALVLKRALEGGLDVAARAARLLPAVLVGSWAWSAGVFGGLRRKED